VSERASLDEASAPATRADQPAPAARTPSGLIDLQQRAGNRAVGRLLARLVEPEAAGTPAPDWSTKDKAEATAAATRTRLRTELLPHMVGHANPMVRNTAEFFSGPNPVLTLDAITKRSDSNALMAKAPAGYDPTLYDAFFLGTSMNNIDYHQTGMIGTLTGSTMYLRGHDSSGTPESLDSMSSSVVHEVSHYLVKQYGEMPESQTDSASFDRYADEFRAYWVEPDTPGGPGQSDIDHAAAIRTRLVGTKEDPASGYPDLHAAYFKEGRNEFRDKVDKLLGPLGFNITNSLRLHRLWQFLIAKHHDNEDIGVIVTLIGALTPAERREARGSSLIAKVIGKLPTDDAARLRGALDLLISDKFEKFMGAVASGKAEDIKAAYADLAKTDRGAMAMNAGFQASVGRLVTDPAGRARIFAMTETGRASQYDAMTALIDALGQAKSSGATELPDEVATALAGLNERVRWSFFLNQSAMKQYVDVLPPKLANIIRERLRD
jgi:hypothetical protein